MSCSVAVASSPVFSPSRIPITCKTPPETLTLTQYNLIASDGSPSSTSCAGGGSSPFRPRVQRGASALRSSSSFDPSSSAPDSLKIEAFRSPLKRKRPSKIDIPLGESLGFEAAAAAAGSVGQSEVEVESGSFSVFCKKGRRRVEMEDRHRADLDLGGDPQMAFFGIFDGHGGPKAAEFVSSNMGELITEELMRDDCGENVSGLEEAVRSGYMKTDAEFLKENVGGGACCVTAFLRKGDLVVSNAGDCRAVLSRGGTAEALTSDHRPSRDDERERIESLGGYVDECRGVWRLQGTLAVSRGIGDLHLKQWVIPEPETQILRIEPQLEFLILASDGLWDKVGNQEAVDISRPLCTDLNNPSPLSACKKLAELSASRGSVDDISVMIILLGHFV